MGRSLKPFASLLLLSLFFISSLCVQLPKGRGRHHFSGLHQPMISSKKTFPSGFNMMELSTRPWLYQLSLKYGRAMKLSDVPESEFDFYINKGINMIWLMGVWKLGQYGLKHDRTDPGLLKMYSQVLPGFTKDDIIGSPYAVYQYVVNPEIGTEDDLVAVRKMLNSKGVLLMLDFVPNHAAVDAPLVQANASYFVRAPKYQNPPYDNSTYLPSGIAYGGMGPGVAFTDTVQYNYWNPDFVQYQIGIIKKIASFADAIRCDIAYIILNDLFQANWGKQVTSWGYSRPQKEFWEVAIPAVKSSYPSLLFLAEVYNPYEPKLVSLGFDYVYDKQLIDLLAVDNLDNVRSYISNRSSFFFSAANFLENHDEPRSIAKFGGLWWKAFSAALLAYTLPGMRFFWMGQWDGCVAKLEVHLRRGSTEPVNTDVQASYDRLLKIISLPVFYTGQYYYLNVRSSDTAWRLIAYRWESSDTKILVLVNFSDQPASGYVTLPNAGEDGDQYFSLSDLLSGESFVENVSAARSSSQGVTFIVNSWYARIFKYT